MQGFTVAKQEEVFKSLVSDLNTHFSLRAKQEESEDESIKAQQSAYSEGLYLGLLEGDTTAADVTLALNNKFINQGQAEKLVSIISNRGRGVDDFTLISEINQDITNGADKEQIISSITANTGTRLTEQTATELLDAQRAYEDKESPLQTNTAKRARDFIKKSIRVTGPLGSLDTEAERRLARAEREFANDVMAGKDPFTVADRLVDKDAFNRAPEPQFGTKSDLQAAMEKTDQAFADGILSDEDYNYQYRLIESLVRQQDTMNSFEQAMKEATNGR